MFLVAPLWALGAVATVVRRHWLIAVARVRATPVVLVGDGIADVLHRTSAHASLVMLGFQPPEDGAEGGFGRTMNNLMNGLGTVVMVWSAGDMNLEA